MQPQQAGTSHPSRADRARRRWEQQVPGSEDEDDGSLSDDGDDPDLEAQMQVGLPLCSSWLRVQGPARLTEFCHRCRWKTVVLLGMGCIDTLQVGLHNLT